jgi:hypothetical protein
MAGCSTQTVTTTVRETVTVAPSDWDSRRGTAWEQFAAGYQSGWINGCHLMWAVALKKIPRLTATDARELAHCEQPPNAESSDAIPSKAPDAPFLTGFGVGHDDGCFATVENVGPPLRWELCYRR